MIHPSKPANAIDTTFSVCDIENETDTGKVLAIGFYDGSEYVVFQHWGQFLEFVFSSKDKRHSTVYAHNGSGWDYLSLLEYVCKHYGSCTFDTIQNGSKLVCIMLDNGGKKVRLLDSLFLLQSSLDKAGKLFTGRGKVETENLPQWYYDNDRATFDRYLKQDCTLLYDTMQEFSRVVFSKIGPIPKLGVTLPSTALKVFTTKYLNRSISIPTKPELREALRSAYQGGRVEVFRPGYHRSINVYDVNSLYPSVMYDTLVPVSAAYRETKKPDYDGCGVAKVSYTQSRGIPILLSRGLGSKSGSGWFFFNELRRLSKLGKIEVHQAYQFTDVAVLFREFVGDLYRLRMTDKDGPLGAVCKLIMNSTYGKFGTKPERSKTCMLTFDQVAELVDKGVDVECISEEYAVYRVTEEKPMHCEHVGIAGTITSEARARLHALLDDKSVYCDTDSVHTPRTMETGSGLGQLKLEFSGEGVYCGKKLYALRNKETEKVRAKGVRVGGKLGCKLGFMQLREVDDGAKIVCTFKAPETVFGVMKGKQPCLMKKRQRTIRRTVGLKHSQRKR